MYRKTRDWFRVLFDDGANLTVHLDPEQEGGAWRMEAPLTAEEARALVVSAMPPSSERIIGRRWKAQQSAAEGGGGGGDDDDDDDSAAAAAAAAAAAEVDCEPTGPAEFLVQLGQDAACRSVWLDDAGLENEFPQLHQQLSQKGWEAL